MPKPTFQQRIVALAALRDPIRRRLYRYVSERTAAVGRDEVAAELRVSRAMAAFHLDKLEQAGLLRAHYRRLSGRTGRGAGRPSKLYRRSRREFAVTIPERNHELLARWLSEAASETGDSSTVDEAAHDYGWALGGRVRRRIPGRPAPQRLADCIADVVKEIGFEPVGADTGEVWSRNCPFEPLSRQYPDVVCHAAVAMVRGVIGGVGADQVSVDRADRPDHCCLLLRGPFGEKRSVRKRPS